jgi:hypothetical protein
MSERLVIHNFGPIADADIEIRDLTVFVGPQATGKSLAAQLLYFFRRFEQVSAGVLGDSPDDVMTKALQRWLGVDPSLYAGPGARCDWHLKNGSPPASFYVDGQGLHASVDPGRLSRHVSAPTLDPSSEPEHVYIPAGRSLYSFVPPFAQPTSLLEPLGVVWPGYILAFYRTLGGWTHFRWQFRGEIVLDQRNQDRLAYFHKRMRSVVKGSVEYGPGTISLRLGERRFPVTTLASGQMEAWPFFVIIEALLSASRLDGACIYFEEPEAHLHPGAQRAIMQAIAYLARQGCRFVLTTHSPYVLYALNNQLMAGEIAKQDGRLPEGVDTEAALLPGQVSAYRFGADGQVHDIMDTETGLIDADELEAVTEGLGAEFTTLQDRLGEQA